MAVVLHTSCGDLPVLLRYRECPKASFNFLALCASGHYDGCCFYRHMPGVLLQAGDPTNTGKGGESIYALARAAVASAEAASSAQMSALVSSIVANGSGRYFQDEGFRVTSHAHRGVLAMAHKGVKPDTNASQFFITLTPQPALDGLYTAFGEIVLTASNPYAIGSGDSAADRPPTGEETLSALEARAFPVDEKNLVANMAQVKIINATIIYNPFADGTIAI